MVCSWAQSWVRKSQPQPFLITSVRFAEILLQCCPSAATTFATTCSTGWTSGPKQMPTSCQSSTMWTGSARVKTANGCGPDLAKTAVYWNGLLRELPVKEKRGRSHRDILRPMPLYRWTGCKRSRHGRAAQVDEKWLNRSLQSEHYAKLGDKLPAEMTKAAGCPGSETEGISFQMKNGTCEVLYEMSSKVPNQSCGTFCWCVCIKPELSKYFSITACAAPLWSCRLQ